MLRERSSARFSSAARAGWIAAALALALGCAPSRETPFLLLITTDTLRADHVGAYEGPGRRLGLTPELDRLAEGSVLFENAFAPASYTLPSIASLMTGRYPEEVGIFANRSMFRGASVTLAEVLRLEGWKTAATVSNYVLRRGTGIEIGFDLYDDTFPKSEENRDQPERLASDTTDAALALLEQLLRSDGAGHFLWVHYQDPHGPYLPPEELRERYIEDALAAEDGARELPSRGINPVGAIPSYQLVHDEHRIGYYRAGYAGEVAHTDSEIGRLLRAVDAEVGLANAIVAFTADHGESLGENDYWFAHGELLSRPLVRVPLWIRAPELEASTRHDVASLVDLFPTLVALTGSVPAVDFAGRDLFEAGADHGAGRAYMATLLGSSTVRRGIAEHPYHYVASQLEDGRVHEWVERLDGEALEGADRERAIESMRESLRAARTTLRPQRQEERQSLSPEDREMLRRLGYTE